MPKQARQSLSDFQGINLNVKMFGAKGDNVHDDSPAFQSAINEIQVTAGVGRGGTIQIPASANYYLLQSDLAIKGGGFKFKGQGLYSRLFHNSASGFVFDVDPGQSDPLSFQSGAGIGNFTMDGPNAASDIQKIYQHQYVRLSGLANVPGNFSAARGTYYFVANVNISLKTFSLLDSELAPAVRIPSTTTYGCKLLYNTTSYVEFEDFSINGFDLATSTRTGGAAFRMQSVGDWRLSNVNVSHCWNGIELRNAQSGIIQKFTQGNYAPNNVAQVTGGGVSIGILVTENSIGTDILTATINVRGTGVVSEAGVQIDKGTDTCKIDGLLAEHCRYGLRVTNNGTPSLSTGSPNFEHDPRLIRAYNCYFEADDATGRGISIDAGADISIIDPYIKGGMNGFHFSGAATGISAFKGVSLIGGCVILAQHDGIVIDSTGQIDIIGTRVSHNGQATVNTYSGIAAGALATGFHIRRVRSGNWLNPSTALSGFAASQKYGFYVDNCDSFSILDCEAVSNLTADFVDFSSSSADKVLQFRKGGTVAMANQRSWGVLDTAQTAIPFARMNTDNTFSMGTLASPSSNGHVLLSVNGTEALRLTPSLNTVIGNGKSYRGFDSGGNEIPLVVLGGDNVGVFGTGAATVNNGHVMFQVRGVEAARFDPTLRLGLNVASPSAVLHIAAGTAAAGTALMKFNAGVKLTSPEAGAWEFTSSEGLLFTDAAGVRHSISLGGLQSGPASPEGVIHSPVGGLYGMTGSTDTDGALWIKGPGVDDSHGWNEHNLFAVLQGSGTPPAIQLNSSLGINTSPPILAGGLSVNTWAGIGAATRTGTNALDVNGDSTLSGNAAVTGTATVTGSITNSALSATKIVLTDSSKRLVSSTATVSDTELGYLAGVTAAIQTQITTLTTNVAALKTAYNAHAHGGSTGALSVTASGTDTDTPPNSVSVTGSAASGTFTTGGTDHPA